MLPIGRKPWLIALWNEVLGEPQFHLIQPGRVGGVKCSCTFGWVCKNSVTRFGLCAERLSVITWISRPAVG